MLEDEQNLVARAKRGESSAFGSLYDFYMPRIYRFVLVKVGQREEAEDITHQTFLKAWENIHTYNFRGHPFGSWLYRIARNTVIDYHRKSRPEVNIDFLPPELLRSEESPKAAAELKMEWEALLASMKKLKDIEQDVLIMRFIEDMPYREIGKIVGKSEGAVKVIQHRALKNLKKLVEP